MARRSRGSTARTQEQARIDQAMDAAEQAGLRYVSDTMPGYSRRRRGKGFEYRNTRGDRITDDREIERIRSIAIPPAWSEVWICPSPDGHILATGRDARGRKQYRYHPRWRSVRDADKYGRLIDFADALPELRKRIDADLRRRGMPREKVVASVLRIMDKTLVRVGNDTYARDNGSFGLTTIHGKHAEVAGPKIALHFRGKGGKDVEVDVRDPRVAKIVRRCQELPGQELFTYLDEDGEARDLGSTHVNQYLAEVTGRPFTAKDFRTWGGTVLAVRALREVGEASSKTGRAKNINLAIDAVAEMLGNTRAVCRRCYVHPAVVEAYEEGELLAAVNRLRPKPGRWLRKDEVLTRRLLERLAAEQPAA